MAMSNQFKYFVDSWKSCISAFKSGKILLLFSGYAVLQILFILMLMNFAYAPFSSFLVPLMKKLFGEPALHYPNNFLVLPSLFFWVNLLMSGFVGIILVSSTTDLFSKVYTKKKVDLAAGFKNIFPVYAILLLVWLVETAVLLGIFFGVPSLLKNISFFVNRGPMATQLATSFVAIFVGALFIYTTALVVIERVGPLRAIGKSLSMFGKYPIITLCLFAIPNLMRMPIDMLTGKTQFLISKFNPEIIAVVMALSIGISIFTNFFLIGTVTKYFLILKDRKKQYA